ncbi:MAG TPA: HypC/HybG/HupF family hydrogenase formation chaperone [Kofleriaceae bacterium]|jgi:hydrogenase expression/formation protein HypC
MCLGIPGQVVDVHQEGDLPMGKVRFGGVSRQVCLAHVPDVAPGDWVLVHVGFALARLDEDEARRVLALLAELGEAEAEAESDP